MTEVERKYVITVTLDNGGPEVYTTNDKNDLVWVKLREKNEHQGTREESKSDTNASLMPISIETLCDCVKSGTYLVHFQNTTIEDEEVVEEEYVEIDPVVVEEHYGESLESGDKKILSLTTYIDGVYGYETNVADTRHTLPIAPKLRFRIRLT